MMQRFYDSFVGSSDAKSVDKPVDTDPVDQKKEEKLGPEAQGSAAAEKGNAEGDAADSKSTSKDVDAQASKDSAKPPESKSSSTGAEKQADSKSSVEKETDAKKDEKAQGDKPPGGSPKSDQKESGKKEDQKDKAKDDAPDWKKHYSDGGKQDWSSSYQKNKHAQNSSKTNSTSDNNWKNNYGSTGSQTWRDGAGKGQWRSAASSGPQSASWRSSYSATTQVSAPAGTGAADADPAAAAPPAQKEPIISGAVSKLIIFVVVYLAVFALAALLLPESLRMGLDRAVSVTIDTVFGLLLLVLLLSGAYVLDKDDRDSIAREIGDFLKNPTSVIGVSVSLFVLYLAKNVLRVPSGENRPWLVGSLETIGWTVFVITFAQFLSHYILKVDMMDAVIAFVNPNYVREKDAPQSAPAELAPPDRREVFNVANNSYTYTDAQAVCSALGARLATYSEVESAYTAGGEWCNYGWSADQMALFPTQKKTWDSLQGSSETKNMCGRPGINGGQMDAKIKFGANCFGEKPKQPASAASAPASGAVNGAASPHDKLVAERAAFYKAHPDQITAINKFNANKWSSL